MLTSSAFFFGGGGVMICSPKVSSARQLATMNKHGVDVFFTKTQRLPGLLNPSPEEQRATGVAAGLLPTVADASVHAVDRMASIQILKCDGDSDNRPQFGRVSAGEVRCSDCDARPGSTAFSVPLLLRGGGGFNFLLSVPLHLPVSLPVHPVRTGAWAPAQNQMCVEEGELCTSKYW